MNIKTGLKRIKILTAVLGFIIGFFIANETIYNVSKSEAIIQLVIIIGISTSIIPIVISSIEWVIKGFLKE